MQVLNQSRPPGIEISVPQEAAITPQSSRKRHVHPRHSTLLLCLLLCTFGAMQGCAPVFSEGQSARLVGEGNYEITTSYTTMEVQRHYGFQAAYGISERLDLRFRYEHVDGSEFEFSDEVFDINANVASIGLKYRLLEDLVAFYLPVGCVFGDDITEVGIWQFHPTLLMRVPFSRYFEFNPAAKVLIPIGAGDADIYFAMNYGFGLSSNLEKWALRPEAGFLIGREGGFMGQFSIGLTWYP